MAGTREHSPPRRGASNPDANHDAARGRPLRTLLDLALRATGAERAWAVVDGDTSDRAPRIALAVSLRPDGKERPSRTLLAWALRSAEPFACRDLARAARASTGESVRALELRSVIAARFPEGAPRDGALVLDGRGLPRLPRAELERCLCDLAELVAGALGQCELGPEPERPASAAGLGAAAFLERLARAAATRLSVLVEGETGSGKEWVARRLHEQSPRRGGPFVAVNCAAFTETLLDAELFGALRGSYTGADRDRAGVFQLAHGGTLFLDEIGDMGAAMQAKLLRVLDHGRVRPVGGERECVTDVRIVAATHHDLAERVATGAFRADLYHRVAVVRIRVPALRERPDDLPGLVAALGPRLASDTGLGEPRLAPCAWTALRAHDWPGNVRELHAVLARALLETAGGRIEARHLALGALAGGGARSRPAHAALERAMVESALRAARGSVADAARRIGWTRQKLYRRMLALGLPTQDRGTAFGITSSASSMFQ